jgi:predicted phage baseplate assembly protein
MPIASPNLDDRTFQQLVDDAKRLVRARCPEWTDHNVSDPGVTLIETFAYMVDQLVYRVNRIPERNYYRFLDLIGVRPFPAAPARTVVTFQLSAPQPEPVVVPAGFEVATERRATEEPVVFTTERELLIRPCRLRTAFARRASGEVVPAMGALDSGRGFDCFSNVPVPGDVLMIGLDDAVPCVTIALRLRCTERGYGIDVEFPPLVWQAWDGTEWADCDVIRDQTSGLNASGDIILGVPGGHTASIEGGDRAGWLRAKVIEPTVGQTPYATSPVIESAEASSIGGSVEAVNCRVARNEILGVSAGVQGQRFKLKDGPVAASQDVALVEVIDRGQVHQWTPVPSFGDSDDKSGHFVMDESSGEVVFGPVVRLENGKLRQYGAVPAKDAVLRVTAYRIGGGIAGNVSVGALTVLKQPLPFLRSVTNLIAATGGVDPETVGEASVRGPLLLRTLNRAVTARDYEHLALEVAPELVRVRCVPAGPERDASAANAVRVLVVPRCTPDEDGRVPFDQLVPDDRTLEKVGRYLEERRLVGNRVVVEPPRYQGITVVAQIRAHRRARPEEVEHECTRALYEYFDPFVGGPEGQGWPFGRAVSEGEAYAVLQQVPGVEYVDETRLFAADPVRGLRGEEVERIELDPNALVYSFQHILRANPAR